MRRDLQRALAVLVAVVSSLGRRSFKASEGGGPAEESAVKSAVVDQDVPDVLHGEPRVDGAGCPSDPGRLCHGGPALAPASRHMVMLMASWWLVGHDVVTGGPSSCGQACGESATPPL
jgi:hypothetical protein